MKNMDYELQAFLQNNHQVNYFHYIYKNDGLNLERKEYIFNMLLYVLFKSYVLFRSTNVKSKVFEILDEILSEEVSLEESLILLKIRVFMIDLETFNEAIEWITTTSTLNLDEDYFWTLIKNNSIIEQLKTFVSYLSEEMDNATRKRRVTC